MQHEIFHLKRRAATFVWVAVEPGLVRQAAYAVMLVGGVSTLLFNGNPLLRYDGYYVLSDLVDVPNLAQRSQSLLAAQLRKWLLGVDETLPESSSPSTSSWYCVGPNGLPASPR